MGLDTSINEITWFTCPACTETYDADCLEGGSTCLVCGIAKPNPCPRCGDSDIQIVPWDRLEEQHTEYRCECGGGHKWDEWLDSKEEAVKAWNERASSAWILFEDKEPEDGDFIVAIRSLPTYEDP